MGHLFSRVKCAAPLLAIAAALSCVTVYMPVAQAAPSTCSITVSDSAGPFRAQTQRALSWWNYALEGTGLSLSLTSAPAQVVISVPSHDVFTADATRLFDHALAYAWPAGEGGPGGIVVDESQDPAVEMDSVMAHEIGHALFAQHMYGDVTVPDPASVMGAGIGVGSRKAWVNSSDRDQVLSRSALVAAAYCPGFAPSAPIHVSLPERQVPSTRLAVQQWAAAVGTPMFASSVEGVTSALSTARARSSAAAARVPASLPVRVLSPSALAAAVRLECSRPNDAEVACPAPSQRPLLALLGPVTVLVDNPDWLALGL